MKTYINTFFGTALALVMMSEDADLSLTDFLIRKLTLAAILAAIIFSREVSRS